MACPKDNEYVEALIDKVNTQYRESPKLLHLMRTYLRQAEIVIQSICDLPSYFDLSTATGDQLTLIGRRMGWPRSHCICDVQPVFGFECSSNVLNPVDGFCTDVTWDDCSNTGISYVSIDDDDLYRKFLSVRRYQMTRKFTRAALQDCIQIFWGEDARIMASGHGEVVVAPGRQLTNIETIFLQLYPRVLPTAPGIKLKFHFGSYSIFGFGTGWLGFCQGSGADGEPLLTEEVSAPILTADGEPILVTATNQHPEWLCKIDVRPYDC